MDCPRAIIYISYIFLRSLVCQLIYFKFLILNTIVVTSFVVLHALALHLI